MDTNQGFCALHNTDDAITRVSLFGNIHGLAAPSEGVEVLIGSHVPKDKIFNTAEGYQTKWWDYRRLAPGHCFLLFTHHYYRHFKLTAQKSMAHRHRDARHKALAGAAFVQYSLEEIWDRDQSHITALWTAMTAADAFGVPYDIFCSSAMNIAVDNNWQRLPKPNQVYSPHLGALTLNDWDLLRRQKMFTASHPIFSIENDAQLPVQIAYRKWLLEELSQFNDPLNALAFVLYRKPQITIADAKTVFSDHLINRAQIFAS